MNSDIREKKLMKLYHSIGLRHNLTAEQVKEIVNSPYEFTKDTINELQLKNIESEEEFDNTKTNFIFKYLGKLYTNYGTIKGRKKQSETFKQINIDKNGEGSNT